MLQPLAALWINSLQAVGKTVQRHQTALGSPGLPRSVGAKRGWIQGERLCATGLPNTQYKSVVVIRMAAINTPQVGVEGK